MELLSAQKPAKRSGFVYRLLKSLKFDGKMSVRKAILKEWFAPHQSSPVIQCRADFSLVLRQFLLGQILLQIIHIICKSFMKDCLFPNVLQVNEF